MRDICPGIFSPGGRERIARKGSGVGGGKKAEAMVELVALADGILAILYWARKVQIQ